MTHRQELHKRLETYQQQRKQANTREYAKTILSNQRMYKMHLPGQRKEQERIKANILRGMAKRYNITETECLRLQNSPCEACDAPPPSHIDHDHNNTRKVRGPLCRTCNLTLGFVKDDVNRLLQLANYLIRYNRKLIEDMI